MRLLLTLSQNIFHSGFFPLCPLLLIPLDDEDELLFCRFGEKRGFLTVLGGGIWQGGGDGDSCLMGGQAGVFWVVEAQVLIVFGSH